MEEYQRYLKRCCPELEISNTLQSLLKATRDLKKNAYPFLDAVYPLLDFLITCTFSMLVPLS